MTRIHFEDPPPRQARVLGKSKHGQIAERLRKRPGDWAKIGNYKTASSMAAIGYMIRRGKATAYAPAGAFEALGRTVNGTYGVWARYVGENGEHA